jgi:hypothetical protein
MISIAKSWSLFQKLTHSNDFIVLSRAIQPQATIHSSIAALVELSASSILNFFSFISISLAAHTLITATHQSSFASLSCSFSLIIQFSLIAIAEIISSILFSISSFSQFHQIIVVLFFEETIVFAFHKSSKVIFSNFIHNSLVIIFAQVSVEISFRISFLSSPKPGFFIAKIFKAPFILFRIIAVNASQSTSSASITKSFFH